MYPIGWSPDNFRKVVLLEGDHRWEMGRNNISSWCSTRLLVLLGLLLFSTNTIMNPDEFAVTTDSINTGDTVAADDVMPPPPTGWSSWSSFDAASEEPSRAQAIPEAIPEVMPNVLETMPSIKDESQKLGKRPPSSSASSKTENSPREDDTGRTRVTGRSDAGTSKEATGRKKKYSAGAFTAMIDEREERKKEAATIRPQGVDREEGVVASSSSKKRPSHGQEAKRSNMDGFRAGDHDPLDELESREMMLQSIPTLFLVCICIYVFFTSSRGSGNEE